MRILKKGFTHVGRYVIGRNHQMDKESTYEIFTPAGKKILFICVLCGDCTNLGCTGVHHIEK